MKNKNKDILKEILSDMDAFAELKHIDYPPIYLLGGSGCIVADYLERATTDIDLIDMNFPSSMGRILKLLENYDFLDLYLTTIPEDFKKRSLKLDDYKNIYVLSREDIILSKIGRFSEIDKQDIKILIEKSDKNLIIDLIVKVIKRNNISKRVKDVFIENVTIFRELFYV